MTFFHHLQTRMGSLKQKVFEGLLRPRSRAGILAFFQAVFFFLTLKTGIQCIGITSREVTPGDLPETLWLVAVSLLVATVLLIFLPYFGRRAYRNFIRVLGHKWPTIDIYTAGHVFTIWPIDRKFEDNLVRNFHRTKTNRLHSDTGDGYDSRFARSLGLTAPEEIESYCENYILTTSDGLIAFNLRDISMIKVHRNDDYEPDEIPPFLRRIDMSRLGPDERKRMG